MPAILPRASRINNYTMIYGLDNAHPQPWFRVMLFEGHFTLHQANAFFQLHDGFHDRIPPTNAGNFMGPVEITCLNIPSHLYTQKQARTQAALTSFSQGFMHPYEWIIAKFSIQSLYPEVTLRIYVARNPWWRGL